MIDLEVSLLESREPVVRSRGEVVDLEIPVVEMLPERDHAHVLDQRREERLVGITEPDDRCERSRGARREDAPPPVLLEVEHDLVVALEGASEAESENQTLDGLESEIGEGLSDRADPAGQSVETRVHGLQHPGRDRRIVFDRLRDLTQLHVAPTGEFEHPDRHCRQRRKLGTLHDPLQGGVVHLLAPPRERSTIEADPPAENSSTPPGTG